MSEAGQGQFVNTGNTHTYLDNIILWKHTVLLLRAAVVAKGEWRFFQNFNNKLEFYVYAKDSQMQTSSGTASILNKGIGIVITFSNAFPNVGPIIKVIGIKNHPLVHPNAADLSGNGGLVDMERFSHIHRQHHGCGMGQEFVDCFFAGIADLDNPSNWNHSQFYGSVSQAWS
jgi:hypothetical protein